MRSRPARATCHNAPFGRRKQHLSGISSALQMSDRDPDSNFPGRDTYGRRSAGQREGSNVSLIIGGIAALLLIIGLLIAFGTN
jgi:hypothetical protein